MVALLLLLACSSNADSAAAGSDTAACCVTCYANETPCGTGCIGGGDQCNQPTTCACPYEE